MDWNGFVWLAFAAFAGLAVDGWPGAAPVVDGVPGDPPLVGEDVPAGVDAPDPDGELGAPEDDGADVLIGLEGDEALVGEPPSPPELLEGPPVPDMEGGDSV
ncbi:hypothetical protein C6A85_72400, partial [Mycobacterium sp. ITM-2017-0098]